MYDQNDSSTIAPANARPRRTLPSIYLANACCLTNKVDELDVIMKQNTIDIAVITETWFKDDTLNIGTIQGYHLFNKIRQSRKGGGVGIYIKDTIPCNTIKSICPPSDDLET